MGTEPEAFDGLGCLHDLFMGLAMIIGYGGFLYGCGMGAYYAVTGQEPPPCEDCASFDYDPLVFH